MREVRYTLLADGSSDQVLIPVLNWLFDRYYPEVPYRPQFAERLLSGTRELAERAREALRLYPCDILFVHRDAERETYDARVDEIRRGLALIDTHFVPVVPVRMTEAWLLSDEQAIRRAANNPNGTEELDLPPAREWDRLPDPKLCLFTALEKASGLSSRRRRSFSQGRARHRVAELTRDFTALEVVPAFVRLRADVLEIVGQFVFE